MSFMAALTAAAPILIPAAIGAAGGAGIGALTSEDGFSDDGWWKGMLAGGLTGGIGGGMGMFSPAGGGVGGLLSPGGSAVALPSSPIVPGAAMPITDYSIFTGATPGASPLSSIMGAAPSTLSQSPTLLSAAEALNPSMLTATGGLNPNFFSGSGLSNTFGGMMPSNDTMMKGLLGSQIFKGMTKQDPKKEWTPQTARLGPVTKMGAPMHLSRRGGQPGGAFMGGGQRGSLGSRSYS
jgi:hypothetical protein